MSMDRLWCEWCEWSECIWMDQLNATCAESIAWSTMKFSIVMVAIISVIVVAFIVALVVLVLAVSSSNAQVAQVSCEHMWAVLWQSAVQHSSNGMTTLTLHKGPFPCRLCDRLCDRLCRRLCPRLCLPWFWQSWRGWGPQTPSVAQLNVTQCDAKQTQTFTWWDCETGSPLESDRPYSAPHAIWGQPTTLDCFDVRWKRKPTQRKETRWNKLARYT